MRWHEWLAAVAMSAGVSVFLRAASPSAGQPHAPALSWWLGGLAAAAVAGAAVAASRGGSATRRAAFLGIATGVSWGFIAAVIKELSSHVDGGPSAIFTNWSVYVLMAAGAGVLLLTSHAMAAGPLAASQPGVTALAFRDLSLARAAASCFVSLSAPVAGRFNRFKRAESDPDEALTAEVSNCAGGPPWAWRRWLAASDFPSAPTTPLAALSGLPIADEDNFPSLSAFFTSDLSGIRGEN